MSLDLQYLIALFVFLAFCGLIGIGHYNAYRKGVYRGLEHDLQAFCLLAALVCLCYAAASGFGLL